MFAAVAYDLWQNQALLNWQIAADIAIGFVVSFIVALIVIRAFGLCIASSFHSLWLVSYRFWPVGASRPIGLSGKRRENHPNATRLKHWRH